MIFDRIPGKIPQNIPMEISQGQLPQLRTPRRLMLSLSLFLALSLSLAACTNVSPALGQYWKGRVLHVNLVTLERTPEFLYRLEDSDEVIHHYRIRPSAEDLELVLIRVKVENHTATSAILNIDRQAAELRDLAQGKYFPFDPLFRNGGNDRVEEVDAPANPADERSGSEFFLWNKPLPGGPSKAFELRKDSVLEGWMVFEVPKDTKFHQFKWRAGDTVSIPF